MRPALSRSRPPSVPSRPATGSESRKTLAEAVPAMAARRRAVTSGVTRSRRERPEPSCSESPSVGIPARPSQSRMTAAARAQCFTKEFGGPEGRAVYGETRAEAATPGGKLPPDARLVIGEAACDADGRRRAALKSAGVVSDMKIIGRDVEFDADRVARFRAGRDGQGRLVAVDGKRAHLSAEVPLDIVPEPAVAQRLAAKIALVAQDIPAHASHTASIESVGQLAQAGYSAALRLGGEIGSAAPV